MSITSGARELEAPKYDCEASITVVWGQNPQRGPGAEEVREAKPPEAETLSDSGRSMEATNFPTFQKCETQKIRYSLCCLFKK